jgi:predicted phage tail protein
MAELEIIKKNEELKLYNNELSEVNVLLEERQQQIEEQSEELRVTNEKLLEKQLTIEEQAEELRIHSKNLKEINDILVEKQQLILKQSEVLSEKNKELSISNATKDRFFLHNCARFEKSVSYRIWIFRTYTAKGKFTLRKNPVLRRNDLQILQNWKFTSRKFIAVVAHANRTYCF